VDNSGEPAAVSDDVKESGDSTKFLSSLKVSVFHSNPAELALKCVFLAAQIQ